MFRGLKAWIKTRNPVGKNANDLLDAIRFENRIKHLLSRIWAIVIDICAIVAAIFSVLSFFKD